MFASWRQARARRDRARVLYAQAVARARAPEIYRDFAVPDTMDGRFDALSLFAALLIEALKAEGHDGHRLASAVLDCMVEDFDRLVREMGIGDVSVGKHVRRMMAAFHGRAIAYGATLHDDRTALKDVLARSLYRQADVGPATLDAMVELVMTEGRHLGQAAKAILAGEADPWSVEGASP